MLKHDSTIVLILVTLKFILKQGDLLSLIHHRFFCQVLLLQCVASQSALPEECLPAVLDRLNLSVSEKIPPLNSVFFSHLFFEVVSQICCLLNLYAGQSSLRVNNSEIFNPRLYRSAIEHLESDSFLNSFEVVEETQFAPAVENCFSLFKDFEHILFL